MVNLTTLKDKDTQTEQNWTQSKCVMEIIHFIYFNLIVKNNITEIFQSITVIRRNQPHLGRCPASELVLRTSFACYF